MTNNASPTATITTQGGVLVVPAGYNPGGIVSVNISNLIASNVVNDANVGGVLGNVVRTTAVAGDDKTILLDTSGGSSYSPTYVKSKEYRINFTGSTRMRVYISQNMNDYGYYGKADVRLNGVSVGTAYVSDRNGPSNMTLTLDLAVNTGDIFSIWLMYEYGYHTVYLGSVSFSCSFPSTSPFTVTKTL